MSEGGEVQEKWRDARKFLGASWKISPDRWTWRPVLFLEIAWVFNIISDSKQDLDWGITAVRKIFRSNSLETEEQWQDEGTLPHFYCQFVIMNRVLWNSLEVKQFTLRTEEKIFKEKLTNSNILCGVWNSVAIGQTIDEHWCDLNLRC